MIKVFKTDLFRLFRTKAFYAFPIFVVIVMCLELIFMGVTREEETKDAGISIEYSSSEENAQVLADETGTADPVSDEKEDATYTRYGIRDILGSLNDGLLLLFLGITVVMFATNESRNGFNKNAAGCVANRGYMPLSKLAAGIVTLMIYIAEFAVIKFIFTGLAALFTGRPMKYVPLPKGDAGRYVIFVMLCILVHIAVTALLILLHELTYNRAAGIVAIFVISAGLFGKIVIGITSLLQNFLGILEGFDISRYLMMSNIMDGYTSENYHASVLFVMALIYLAGGTAAAVLTAKRKDIR